MAEVADDRSPIGREVSPLTYAIAAPLLLLAQHALVALVYRMHGAPLRLDSEFWWLPMRRLATMPGLSATAAALAFAATLLVSWGLAMLSLARANRARRGHWLAAFSVVPLFQVPAIAVLAVTPGRRAGSAATPEPTDVAPMLQGLLAGMAIIVFAVLISAVTFGAYGWGLFVLTPATVGVATGYAVNRGRDQSKAHTFSVTLGALGLSGIALIAFALEGAMCIIMAAPLAVSVAFLGALIGQFAATVRADPRKPFLTVAVLPAIFVFEAAVPPELAIATDETIVIDAPSQAVWRALISDRPLVEPPGLVGRAGLAYPLGGRILGSGLGAERLGFFSTGTARERVTRWSPGRRLAFTVVSQPPAMEEMSPYRRVHAPHVLGYFDTAETDFSLQPLTGDRTRLTVRSGHVLRIDPVFYWGPIARWAIGQNARRALRSIKRTAERES